MAKKAGFITLKEATDEFKRKLIFKMLEKYYGNVSFTAKKLGISRNTLIIQIDKIKMHKEVKMLSLRMGRKRRKGFVAKHARKVEKNLFKEKIYKFQRSFLKKALRYMKANEVKTAILLKIHRNTLINKVNYLNLNKYLNDVRTKRREDALAGH